MTIRIPAWLIHHALKIGWPLAAVALMTRTRHQPWYITAPNVALGTAGVILVLLGALHMRYAPCRYCRPRPQASLRYLHYRAWAAWGRRGGPAVALLLLAWIMVGVITDRNQQTLPDRLFSTGLLTFAVAYVSGRRFSRLNYGPEVPHRVRDFVQQHCARLMHKSHWLIIGTTVFNVATLPLSTSGPWSLLSTAAIVALGAAWYLDSRHRASLCEECVTEFRTDAPEYAAQHRRRFQLHHQSLRAMLPLLAVALGAHWVPTPWRWAVLAAANAGACLYTGLGYFHSKYQPWCPWCRNGGGGGREEAPQPTPDSGRPLPVA